jgi:hypothetical protein
MTPRRVLTATLLLLVLAPTLAQAQRVEVRGRGDADNDAFLRELVSRGEYVLIAKDTTIAATDTIPGTALVLGTTLRLDGVIAGDLVIVDANVFLRPSGRVLGRVRNIAGGYYPSELASVHGGVRTEPNAAYLVERPDAASIHIVGTTQRSVFVRYGLAGLLPPTYDRVDGVTVGVAAGYLLPRIGRIEPVLKVRADYRTQRGAAGGAVELAAARRRTEVAVGVERTTATNERWIRGDLTNSVTSLWNANDRRDYYAADRAWAELRRQLEGGPRTTHAFVRAQVEDASPLRAGNPWSVLGDFREDNIVFDESRISSVLAGLAIEWSAPRHVLSAETRVEAGSEVLDGDHAFAMFVVDTDWAMVAFRDHTLRVETHFQGPLPGTTTLPGQRWSFVGGGGTLPTFEEAEFRGDRIALVETQYHIPLPRRLRVRLLGVPTLELLHMAGMGWTADDARAFEQNVGARLRYSIVNVRVLTNPRAVADDMKLSIGVQLPQRKYPWQESP